MGVVESGEGADVELVEDHVLPWDERLVPGDRRRLPLVDGGVNDSADVGGEVHSPRVGITALQCLSVGLEFKEILLPVADIGHVGAVMVGGAVVLAGQQAAGGFLSILIQKNDMHGGSMRSPHAEDGGRRVRIVQEMLGAGGNDAPEDASVGGDVRAEGVPCRVVGIDSFHGGRNGQRAVDGHGVHRVGTRFCKNRLTESSRGDLWAREDRTKGATDAENTSMQSCPKFLEPAGGSFRRERGHDPASVWLSSATKILFLLTGAGALKILFLPLRILRRDGE